jgi:hypothetical protein
MTTRVQLATATQRQLKEDQSEARGIRAFEDPSRRSPFGVQWAEFIVNEAGVSERKRRTLFFKNAADRDRKAKELSRDRITGKTQVSLSRAEQADYTAMLATFNGVPWQTIYGISACGGSCRAARVTVVRLLSSDISRRAPEQTGGASAIARKQSQRSIYWLKKLMTAVFWAPSRCQHRLNRLVLSGSDLSGVASLSVFAASRNGA